MERIGNPWLGLASYEEKDEYRFKGRSKDVECVLTKLQQNDCLVCYAESGAGKSSLINAGLSPAMRRNGMFPIRIKFTTEEYDGKNIPVKEDKTIDFDKLISDKIHQSIEIYKQNVLEKYDFGEDFEIKFERIEQYKTEQRKNISSLWWKLRTETIRITFGEYDYIPVLIFDQFEEVFSATWKKGFFQWLEILMKDVCSDSVEKECKDEGLKIPNKKLFKLLLSLRSEYIGELDYWCGQITYIPQTQKNRYFLKPLTREQAIEVISAQDQNDEISKKLKEEADNIVDSILDASGKEKDDSDINEVPSVALSLVCYILYNEWIENESFSLNKYELNELIYDFYRRQLNSISVADNHRRILESVLISSHKKRLRIPISDTRLQEIYIQKYLNSSDNLLTRHIIKCENINGEKYIELVHDCLVEAIYKKSREEQEKRHLKKRILRTLLVAVVVLLCVFVGGLIWYQYKAQKTYDVIYARFMIEKANNLSNTGYEYLATNMVFSGLSNIVDVMDVQSCKDDVLLETLDEAEAILRNINRKRLNPDAVWLDVKCLDPKAIGVFFRNIAFSNDGNYIVTNQAISKSSYDSGTIFKNYVAIWDTKIGECVKKEEKYTPYALFDPYGNLTQLLPESIRPVSGAIRNISSISFHPDGKTMIYINNEYSESNEISVLDLKTKTLIKQIKDDKGFIGASISPKGDLIVTAHYSDSIDIWGYETGEIKKTINVYNDGIKAVYFITDKDVLCVGEKGIEKVDIQSGKSIMLVEEECWSVNSSSISPDCRYIAISVGFDIKIFSIKTGICVYSIDLLSRAKLVSFSPDGKKIAIAMQEGDIYILSFLSFQEIINDEIKILKEHSHSYSKSEYEEYLKLKKYFKINYKN